MEPKLTLTFDAGFGESYSMCISLSEHVARQFSHIEPPMKHGIPWSNGVTQLESFEQVVSILKTRELRKDVFMGECKRLGALLAERMEDAEGWHDVSRIEPAKHALR